MQAFLYLKTSFPALFLLILLYAKLFAIFLAYLTNFLYLCTITTISGQNYINYSNSFPKTTIMQQNQCLTMGRTELAQRYFPYIQPKSAWEKLRSLLLEDPDLEHLTRLRRRTFLPAEVNIIYQHLGQP